MRTTVGIIGAGPAGLTLALLLAQQGIPSVVLEARDRAYVEGRVRAGLLEQNTVEVLRSLDAAERLDREGMVHDGINLRVDGDTHRVDIFGLTGRQVTVYGQQEIVKDLVAALLERGGSLLFEVSDVAIHNIDSASPRITFVHDGEEQDLRCDIVAGCDGFHGVSRQAIPSRIRSEFDYSYPFAWLGILAAAPPATDELIYGRHERGFALYSMRSPETSRLYIQVPADEQLAVWPDHRIWEELQTRLGTDGWRVNEGPILDKGITPMRSFVCEPMQHGRMFLAGDAAHIVPPTGAKGLNLAVNDARLLAAALVEWSITGVTTRLDRYTQVALQRVWRAQEFSNFMTHLLHDLGPDPFARRLQLARLDYLARSESAARSLAENYVGLPARDDF